MSVKYRSGPLVAPGKVFPLILYHTWLVDSFRGRHLELTIRTAEKLAYARVVAQDQSVLDHYFDLLEQTLLENELTSFPSRNFNVDESGFPLQAHNLVS